MNNKKNLFYGYYGKSNTGDDAFIEVTAWGANKYWNNHRNKYLTEKGPIVQNHVEYIGNVNSKFDRTIKYLRAITNADTFISAGGSTFQSQIKRLSPRRFSVLKKKYCPKFKIGAIGVSLGPYSSIAAENENIELLKNFDFLALRDRQSYEMALQYNLPYRPIEAFDLAALLPEVYNDFHISTKDHNRKILGVSLCNYERYIKDGDLSNEARRNKQNEELLLKIAHLDSSVIFRFFIFNGNQRIGDYDVSISLANKIKEIRPNNVEVINYNSSTFATWSKIKECNLFFSTRLHGAIFACFANVPFFLNEYHKKCSDFLDDIGYFSNYRISDAHFNPEKLAFYITSILTSEKKYINPTQINKCITKAKNNFRGVDL